ncbi:MAG: ROK family protein [Chitinophagaceae bacterium]|nr:ROK family protein [Chitinophagaceae bacterium]MCW5928297.1 ROK family protein [Chitinophagaceae bacterium]
MKSTRILAIDLGGTKAAFAVLDAGGVQHFSSRLLLEGRSGTEVGELLVAETRDILHHMRQAHTPVSAIGIAVPGAVDNGYVWAPKIPGWEAYPLLNEIQNAANNLPVVIESDRTCYILGECWMGNARDCNDVIFLSVGTGIGAGILVNGKVLKGIRDIGGAIGWMVMPAPEAGENREPVRLEEFASGSGIPLLASVITKTQHDTATAPKYLSAEQLITAYDTDPLARAVIDQCIIWWGMTIANLTSIFNPEKIIVGGGVFGPATRFIPQIKKEAEKWAQPLSSRLYHLEASKTGQLAGVYGAARAALDLVSSQNKGKNVQ